MKDPHIRLILDTSAVLSYAAGSIALFLLVVVVLMIRLVIRAMRALFRGAGQELAG